MVALLGRPVADDHRQGSAVHPLAHQHAVTAVHHVRHQDVGVAVVRRCKRLLRGGLEGVVELFRDAGLELAEQRLDVEAGVDDGEQPGHSRQLVEVGEQGRTRAGVLQLHRHLAAVVPAGPMHLTDRCGSRRLVAELLERGAPVLPESAGEDLVHRGRRHRRRGLLQLGQRRAVRAGEVFGQRSLEHRQRLAELHRPALELAEDAEQLLSGARLQLARDQLGGSAPDALAEADRPSSCHPQRETRKLGATRDRPPGHVAHITIVAEASAAPHPHDGCGAIERRRSCPSSSPISRTPPAVAGNASGTSMAASTCPAASAAAMVASTTSQDPTARGPSVNCAVSAAQCGSRSARARCMQRRQGVRPGCTNGPTTAVVSRTVTSRCAWWRTAASTSGGGTVVTGATTDTSARCGATVLTVSAGLIRRSGATTAVARVPAPCSRMPAGPRSAGRTGPSSTTASLPTPPAAHRVATAAPTRPAPWTATLAARRRARTRAAAPGPGWSSDSESRSGSRRGSVGSPSSSASAAASSSISRTARSGGQPSALASLNTAATSRLPSSSPIRWESGGCSPASTMARCGASPSWSVTASRHTWRSAGLRTGRTGRGTLGRLPAPRPARRTPSTGRLRPQQKGATRTAVRVAPRACVLYGLVWC